MTTNISNQWFNNLFVINLSHTDKNNRSIWNCICRCKIKEDNSYDPKDIIKIMRQSLVSGNTQSCGCLRKERLIEAITAHGDTHTRLFRIWINMRRRCVDPNKDQEIYIDRNITVCEEWNTSYLNFKNDMGFSYEEAIKLHGEKNISLDRIEGDKGYYKDNCRWATLFEQNSNKRIGNMKWFEGTRIYDNYKEKSYNLSEFAKKYDLHRPLISKVLDGIHSQHKGWNFRYLLEIEIPNGK